MIGYDLKVSERYVVFIQLKCNSSAVNIFPYLSESHNGSEYFEHATPCSAVVAISKVIEIRVDTISVYHLQYYKWEWNVKNTDYLNLVISS